MNASSSSRLKLARILLGFLKDLSAVFAQERTQHRAWRLSIATTLVLGTHTIARMLASIGRDQEQWSSDYQLFSRCQWHPRDLYTPVLHEALDQGIVHARAQGFLLVAGDHTHLKKTGTHIEGVRTIRDPMSPPYHVNLIQGLRFFHLAMILSPWRENENPELSKIAPRAIPVRFEPSPILKKPGKKATVEEHALYKKKVRERPAAMLARQQLEELRADLDKADAADLPMLAVLDGGFCNRVFLREPIERVELLCRCRKDAVLCLRHSGGGRRFYSEEKFRPEEIRTDEQQPWIKAEVRTGGKQHAIRYKELSDVYWQRGSFKRSMRIIVVAPTGYRLHKKGRLLYRQPAYLLTTDLSTPAIVLIQAYIDRWQIEVAHRELKEDFGLQDTQVRNEKSVPRHPSFEVAVYAMIHLATLKAYGPRRTEDFLAQPKWGRPCLRPSFIDILRLLRHQLPSLSKRHFPKDMEIDHQLLVEKAAA